MNTKQAMVYGQLRFRSRYGLALLICFHIAICCVSPVYVADTDNPVAVDPAAFHMFFDPARLHIAVVVASAFALVCLPFIFARFMGAGNSMSDGLPPRFILPSAAMLAAVLLNIPLSIVLLTHGAAILFLLWYIMPRTIFEKGDGAKALRVG